APLLAPPPVELSMGGDMHVVGKRKGRGLVKALVGGIVLLGGAAVAFVTLGDKTEPANKPAATASAGAAEVPTEATEPKQPSEPPAASAETAASASAAAVTPGQSAPKPESEKKTVAAKVD